MKTILSVGLFVCVSIAPSFAHEGGHAPEGFTNLFDGKSLDGWAGRPHLDPRSDAAMSDEELTSKQAEWNRDRDTHWSVDAENEEIVSDGHGVFLTTEKEYGDFELYVDWNLAPHGDSGIYLRGSPQVQIWDPNNPEQFQHGNEKGSGGLWNNNDDNRGKWPLVKADAPCGEWNTFRIKMIGSRVWIWLNGQQTVDGQIMDNYFDRALPIFAKGVIQLQTHGAETRFRNIYVREIGPDEANATLRGGFTSIFNGRNFDGWKGPTEKNGVKDGSILAQFGTIFTEKEYGDFQVRFEFKLPPGGNNGLAIRYPGSGDAAYGGMCEIQVLDNDAPRYAKLDPRQYHGSVYGMIPARRGYLRPAGDWNFEVVTVIGSKIMVELNGTLILNGDVSKVADFMSGSPDKHPGKDRTRGHFGLAGHGDPVLYRNLEIKEL